MMRAGRASRSLSGPFALATGPRAIASVLLLSRLLTLTLIGAFAGVAGHLGVLAFDAFRPWWLLTIVIASVFSWLQFSLGARLTALVPVTEAMVAVLLVGIAGAEAWPLVIYLVMAPVFVGVAVGGWMPVVVAGAQIAALYVVWLAGGSPWQGLPFEVLLRLTLVGLLFGAATTLVRLTVQRSIRRPGGYAQALALLEQLRELTRELPSGLGLDAVTAETQAALTDELGAVEVALFVPRSGTWSLQAGPAAAAVLATRHELGRQLGSGLQPLRSARFDPSNDWTDPEYVRVLALRASGHLRAVAAARYSSRPRPISADRLRGVAEDAAARLAAAEVYAEVRERATAEERRRVSREIHDGVAQDLAALTYSLDNIAAETQLEPVAEAAEEVRRLVRELRLSIFDLRTDLGTNEALGTAIGQYAQQVATSTGIVVHTTVSEHGVPPAPHIQHELLRVCQEAVTNARRHSRARNMWITYKNHGAGWLLRVADDGVGVGAWSGRNTLGGEGLAIMRERVVRVGGHLAVRRRIGGGTVIEVTLERGHPIATGDGGQDSPARPLAASTTGRVQW